MNKVIAFLPCRQGSQRVKNKNIKPFAGIEGGFISIKLTQLLKVEAIDKIVVSTNDVEVKRIALLTKFEITSLVKLFSILIGLNFVLFDLF